MIGLPLLTPRQWLIVIHDLVVTAIAVVVTFALRFEDARLAGYFADLPKWLPLFVVYAGLIYALFGLYKAKWRFASLPDLKNIFVVSTVLALTLLVLDYIALSPNVSGAFYFGKITIVLYWLLQMACLSGPRIAYRYFRDARTRQRVIGADSTPTLVFGDAADADMLVRAIESGAVKKIWPVGILSPSTADQGQAIRGVPVLGKLDKLDHAIEALSAEGIRVARIVLTASALNPDDKPEAILMQARRLGLAASRLPALQEGSETIRLAPIAVEDLLLRPSAIIDYRRLENFVKRQVDRGDRRRRLDRRGNLRTRRHLRRGAAPGGGKLRARALRGAGAAGGAAAGCNASRAGSLTSATATACSACWPISSPTSCSTPRRSSRCRCSSGTGGRASRPTCSVRSMSPMPRLPQGPGLWS